MRIGRRKLLKFGGATAIAAALPLPFVFARQRRRGNGLVPDARGVLDLAPDFSYRILERAGERMSDGLAIPGRPDGMGCFAGPNGTLILMRNHELGKLDAILGRPGAPPEAFDKAAPGGVSRLVLDARSLDRISSNLVLTGTLRNCAGGVSPWGWLSCEESTAAGHGYVFLCRTTAARLEQPIRVSGYGRFNHEAVAIDPATHVAYLTEDRGDSCLYRFVPNDPAKPFEGRLQAMKVRGVERFDTSDLRRGKKLELEWLDVPNPDSPADDLRRQMAERGAALVRRGEGAAFHGRSAYLCSTTGGPENSGQIFVLTPEQAGSRATLELVAEATNTDSLDCPDNITVAPWGDVLVAEDGGGEQLLRGITPRGHIYDIARNARIGEFAGVCLSPDAKTLFVNMQIEGLTVAISGPLQDLRKNARPSA
jgi:uncharacterized protein